MPILGLTASIAATGQVTSLSGKVRNLVNVFSYEHTAGPLDSNWPLNLIQQFEAVVWSQVTALLSSSYFGNQYHVYTDPHLTPPAPYTFGVGVGGAVAGDRLPLSFAVSVHVRSGLRGRNYRGTKRYGPVPDSHYSADELTAAGLAAWQAAAATFLSALTSPAADVWKPVVLSRDLSASGPPASYVGAALTSVEVVPAIGNSRHRKERTVLHEVIPQHGI